MKRDMTPYAIPKNPHERRAWICFQLKIRGLSQRQLAKKEKVSPQCVSSALIGGGSSHLQEAVANAIGLSVQQLFPELYNPTTGERLLPVRPRKRTTHCELDNVKSDKAA